MKTAVYGRIVFGLSAVLFGVIALMWHDADTWQTLSALWKLPFGGTIGGVLMAGQIVGGIAMLFPRTARWASIVLAVVYTIFSLACIPGIVAHPATYAHYGSLFEQVALLCGAIAVYAEPKRARPRRRRSAGRRGSASACARSHSPWPRFSIFASQPSSCRDGFRQTRCSGRSSPRSRSGWPQIGILINVQARLAMRLMAAMIALFGVLVWVPLLIAHPEAHLNWSEFALTCLIAGASWLVAERA